MFTDCTFMEIQMPKYDNISGSIFFEIHVGQEKETFARIELGNRDVEFTEEIVINTSRIRHVDVADGALAIGAARLLLLPRETSRGKTQPRGRISWHLDNRLQFSLSLSACHYPPRLPAYATTEIAGQVAIRPADKGGWSIVFFSARTGSCVRGRPRTLSRRISVSHANYPSCLANGFRGLPGERAR